MTNLHGVFLVPILVMAGRAIHRHEMLGGLIAMIGAFLLLLDPDAQRVGQRSSTNFGVDLTLIISNIPATLFFAMSKSLMRDRIVIHLLLMNLFTAFLFTMLCLVCSIDGRPITISQHPTHGIFGWTRDDLAFQSIALYGFLGTFWGSSVGYLLVMKFFSPQILMSSLMFEALLAQPMGYMFGIDHFPGPISVFGMVVCALGVAFLNYGT